MSTLFSLDQSNRLVFVSQVPRGLACHCRCVVCGEPLLARQGEVREHHFAHASGREPCNSSHESLLHRYAKQVIAEAGSLVVPISQTVGQAIGIEGNSSGAAPLQVAAVEVERSLGDVRPDLLITTSNGIQIAVEVAYSSFCDLVKVQSFATLCLPALEIDLSRWTPEAFDPEAVRLLILEGTENKTWAWPRDAPSSEASAAAPELHQLPASGASNHRLPEEIVTISDRWVSIKTLPSGDIAVRCVSYDPDVVSLIKTITRPHGAQYSAKWKSWNVPRWRAEQVRRELRGISQNVSIFIANKT
jgi:competence protein CoiA